MKGYSKIAHPLHLLTQKNVSFHWTCNCQHAFEEIKSQLASAPVLAYPQFDKDFVLETDASRCGLGAVLSQIQEDSHIHPVAYASKSVSSTEANYSITELETSNSVGSDILPWLPLWSCSDCHN